MNFINDIFRRVNLGQLSAFLIYGIEADEISEKTYKERIDECHKTLHQKAEELFSDKEQRQDFVDYIFDLFGVYENVFMEIGTQVGFKLAAECLNTNK